MWNWHGWAPAAVVACIWLGVFGWHHQWHVAGKKIGWAAPKLPRGPPAWKNGEQEFQTGHKTAGCCWVLAPGGAAGGRTLSIHVPPAP